MSIRTWVVEKRELHIESEMKKIQRDSCTSEPKTFAVLRDEILNVGKKGHLNTRKVFVSKNLNSK